MTLTDASGGIQPMETTIVLTLSGPDRVGIVDEITGALFDLGANVETSRMARLGGEFAILMQVVLSAEQRAGLHQALEFLSARGYRFTVAETEEVPPTTCPECLTYEIAVTGADHEGIVHDIAHGLSQRGINITSLETATSPAPVSGTPLFSMTAVVEVPPTVPEDEWKPALTEAAHRENVDVRIGPVTKR